MRIFTVVALLLMLFGVVAFAESQPPSPSGWEKTEQTDTNPQKDKESTDQLQIPAKTLAPISKLLDAQSQKEASHKTTTQHDEKSSDKWWKTPSVWDAVFTGILTFITGTLAYFTFLLWRSTKTMVDEASLTSKRQAVETQDALKLSRRAAAAAEKAAELAQISFLTANRPKIILRDAYCSSVEIGDFIEVHYVLANVGGSAGKIAESAISIENLSDFNGWGAHILPSASKGTNPIGKFTLQPGEQQAFTFTSTQLRWGTDNGTRHDFQEQNIGVFFSGHLVYTDDRGIKRNMAFHRRHKIGPERFFKVDDKCVSALEYE